MNDTISIKKTGKQILVFLFFLFLIFFFLFKGKDVSQILKIAASASFPAIVAGIVSILTSVAGLPEAPCEGE